MRGRVLGQCSTPVEHRQSSEQCEDDASCCNDSQGDTGDEETASTSDDG